MTITGETRLGNIDIVEPSCLKEYMVGTREWFRTNNTREIALHLAIAEKLNFPDKTVYGLLSGIAESTKNLHDEWIDTADVVTLEDVQDIIDDDDDLDIVDMMIHTFDMEHMASYVIGNFGRH